MYATRTAPAELAAARERRRAVAAALMVVGVGSCSPSAASKVKRTYLYRCTIYICIGGPISVPLKRTYIDIYACFYACVCVCVCVCGLSLSLSLSALFCEIPNLF
jgi:hypothetical protein